MSVQVQDHPSIKVIVSGVSGVGKTTLWEKLVRKERNVKHFFLYDHKQGDLARRFNVRPIFEPDEIVEAVARGQKEIFFNPAKHFAGKKEDGFKLFSALVWDICQQIKGKKIFGADELQSLIDNRNEPEELCKILDEGRTFQIDCYFISQAMNSLHNQVRKQFTEIFVMKQGDKIAGGGWLEEKGFDRNEISGLKNGEFLYLNTNDGATAKGGKAFVPKNSERNLAGL